jgi:hypothetical protein
MASGINPKSSPRKQQHFGVKITLIVVVIIALSQGLGTFLSVLSFEEIYLKALISKYEVLGKDLQRQIQQAVKFGKPLDLFLGMDRLVEPLFLQAEELSDVIIFDPVGKTLFSFNKVQLVIAKGAVDEKEHPRGKVLLNKMEQRQPFPFQYLEAIQGDESLIQQHQGKYYILFSIKPRLGVLKGYLGLAFNSALLDKKKKELIRRSLNKLLIALFPTTVLVVLLIRFVFVRPAQHQVEQASATFENKEDVLPNSGLTESSEEILTLQLSITDFMTRTLEIKREVLRNLESLESKMQDRPYPSHVIRLMKKILTGSPHEDV